MRDVSKIPRKNIKTRRLVLEPADPRHRDALWPAIEKSLEELRPWLAWTAGTSPDDLAGYLERSSRAWKEGVAWNYMIVENRGPIGSIGLPNFDGLVRQAEIGYWIASDRAGQGFMTEAASAVIDFGFEKLGLHRIELRAATENLASIRVAEKLGFRREGTLRESGMGAAGDRHDHHLFGLLETDPRPNFHK
jgi:ribosomal-protein-serine acetyltransferase